MRQLLLLLLLMAVPAWATVPSGFTETDYLSNELGSATGLAWAPDGSGRLFVTIKTGQVRIVSMKNGELETSGNPARLVTKLFATEPNVHTNSECGVIGIAFDPNYVANRYVYIFVTVSATEQQIVRYTDSNDVGISRTVLVSGLPTRGQNHDGGGIGFGPDGKLYWSIGDLGNGTGVDADLTSLAAKVSRANRDGTPANDNPFNDGVGPNNEFIWARGFRNPFTFTFQPSTGQLWVNVVGTGYEQTFVVNRRNHAGYDDYENNQPSTNDYITPVIKYRTNGADTRNLTTAARAGGVTTLTTGTQRHGFRKGEKLTIAGVADATFNGDFYVASVPGDTTVTVAQAGQPDATSTGGTARTQELGGCMNGGVFYDATLFPEEYRGNFFFGDYNSSNFMRVTLAGDNTVATVDPWGSNFSSYVDVAVGPDGALYTIGVTGGRLRRITPSTVGQKLVVTHLFPRVVEGGRATFTVRLAQAPTEPVLVDVYRAPGGSTDLRLTGPTAFTFTSTDWSVPRVVTLEALEDADADPDTATFIVGSNGLSSESVVATTIDDNQVQLVLSSTNVRVPEGGTATFDVSLSRQPTANVTFTVARTTGDTDITVQAGGSLTFTPSNWSTPQTVTLAAAQDADNVDGVATISLTAPKLDSRTVTATEVDDEPLAPVITSTAPTSAVVGSPYRYDVEVQARPAATFSLTASPPGMSIDAASGLVTWTPTTAMSTTVTVDVRNGVSPNATQTFTLVVKQDDPPRAVLTRPRAEERVAGDSAEFYGDCFDDVGCTRAEFFIDGQREYAENRTDNHFHFGGEHNRWNTTGLAPGGHLVKFAVIDTGGARHEVEVKVCVGDGSCDLVPPPDAGGPDGGASDGGTSDGGTSDAGITLPPDGEGDGCGCGSAAMGPLAWGALMALALTRRRRARR
ncbi:PQQ-dependent sugar dehydrogenase [Myxococcus sp. K15C18031901]|uniref:PQQ-dependent sugar dehydrogenase n=1 Tax=Myxococcus dinghuensis TaxID=2906761 RepID=UPI0020A7DCE7|nr:PQQ-dependent sugar dehydrogenase [Myxococcus dinghuensis]MCP3104450.1 PQQ-dependent sugar dehydrogenase [Myxococcus dinghuensis]